MNIPIGRFLKDGLTIESIESAFRRILAAITAGWGTQHKSDGTHSDISADTIAVAVTPSAFETFVPPSFAFNVADQENGTLGIRGHDFASGIQRTAQVEAVWTGSGDPAMSCNLLVDSRPGGGSGTAAQALVSASVQSGTSTITLTADAITMSAASGLVAIFGIINNATWQGVKIGLEYGGTNANLSATGGTSQFLRQASAGAAITVVRPAFADLSDYTAWTAVAYNAGDFTASTGNWTVDSGDIGTFTYTRHGKTLTVAWAIAATDVSANSVLRITIPGGFTAGSTISGVHRARDAGGARVIAACQAASGNTYIELFPSMDTTATWTITAADNTATTGQLTFEIA